MTVDIRVGDALEVLRTLPDESVQCCVTSPPYWGLRDYGVVGQLGLEKTPDEYVARMVEVFREVRRVLKDDGTLWINLGDSYASKFACDRRSVIGNGSPSADMKRPNRLVGGLKEKDLVGIPWLMAFALRADGWYLRSDIIWHKPNPMPESVTDRPTKAHEYLFLLTKSPTYYYDADAIAEPTARPLWASETRTTPGNPDRNDGGGISRRPLKQDGHGRRHAGFNARWDAAEDAGETTDTRNRRTVWTVATHPYSEAHFATFPPALIEPCILAGSRIGNTVLDPFFGAGTTGLVCDRLNRNCIGVELNPTYAEMARKRIFDDSPLFNGAA